jgi:phage baseplate assembly protein W
MKKGGYMISSDGRIQIANDDIHVKHSLRALILTRLKERPLYEEIGEGVEECLFRTVYPGLFDEIREKVETVIQNNEPRVELLDTDIEKVENDGIGMNIHLKYKIRNTNKIENLNLNMVQ